MSAKPLGDACDAAVISCGPATEPERIGDGKNEVIVLKPDNVVQHRRPIKQEPSVALRVDGGWLAGSSRGEWGGELVFIADDGPAVVPLDENVLDIHGLGERTVVLTGLSHMGMNNGMVREVSRDASGHWTVRPWRALPGAPSQSWRVETGELLIDVYGGGTLLLHPDGSFRMAPCSA